MSGKTSGFRKRSVSLYRSTQRVILQKHALSHDRGANSVRQDVQNPCSAVLMQWQSHGGCSRVANATRSEQLKSYVVKGGRAGGPASIRL